MRKFPPALAALLLSAVATCQLPAAALELYSHGDPTPEEQYMLELMNRARANPAQEGKFLTGTTTTEAKYAIDYFKVDLAQVRKDFASYPARPPLAFNPQLMAAAKRHSKDMASNNFQSHTGSDKSTVSTRILGSGYSGAALNESIYSNLVPDVTYAHVGFNIDWGVGTGGVQTGLGHRLNIMNWGATVYNEVGIGVSSRSGEAAATHGKLAITQDFGLCLPLRSFLLGVVFQDANGNGICDPGEGIPGVQVVPSAGTHYAVTSASGGYAIPFGVATGGSVTFSGAGITPVTREFTVAGSNRKIDLIVPAVLPGVRLVKLDGVAGERPKAPAGTARFQIVRTGPAGAALKVALNRSMTSTRGKAAPSDYTLAGLGGALLPAPAASASQFTVTLAAGQATADVELRAVNDKLKEPAEKVTFTLANGSAYQIDSTKAVKIKIVR